MDRAIALIAVALCTVAVGNVNAQEAKHNTEARVITRDHNPTVRDAVEIPLSNAVSNTERIYVSADTDRYDARIVTRDNAPRVGHGRDRLVHVRINGRANVYLNARKRYDITDNGRARFDDRIYLERARALHDMAHKRATVIRGSELHYTTPADAEPQDVRVEDNTQYIRIDKPQFKQDEIKEVKRADEKFVAAK